MAVLWSSRRVASSPARALRWRSASSRSMSSPCPMRAVVRVPRMGRVEPPIAGDEVAAVLGELDRVRSYIAWKCGGLDAAGLRATLPPSTMTLGGLLKHLALVEDAHFAKLLFDQEPGPPWDGVDWDADPDWEWRTAADDSPEELM